MKQFTVLIDMDEVCVDFVGGAIKLFGWTEDRFLQSHPPGQWDITPTLGVDQTEFWRRIDAEGIEFWTGLKEFPWLDHLLQWVEQNLGEWYLVTTPGLNFRSYAGKRAWLQMKFGYDFDRCVFTAHKHLLAKPKTLLIDDSKRNIERFLVTPTLQPTGADAILFPAYTNSQCIYRKEPIRYLNCLITVKEQSNAVSFHQCQ